MFRTLVIHLHYFIPFCGFKKRRILCPLSKKSGAKCFLLPGSAFGDIFYHLEIKLLFFFGPGSALIPVKSVFCGGQETARS